MLKVNVKIGGIYIAKISGNLTRVHLDRESEHGGWWATNLATRREVRIRSAAKLRREITEFEKQNLGAF